ncbi:hypothetical protein [Collimonas sp. OK307]|uniref:hypothetical protein n=1 Tax=Collimonas sp. OK307 TaxID=1801620 RepID=UPI000B832874|nr:hypothetical protein [Collimonas sp. OK307]
MSQQDMHHKFSSFQLSLYVIAAAVLLVGLLSAGLIYRTAAEQEHRAGSYQIIDGHAYEVAPGDSKAYLRDMELYGGTSGILIANFNRWLGSLWHGKRLAYLLAIFSVVIAYICFSVARGQMHDQPESH